MILALFSSFALGAVACRVPRLLLLCACALLVPLLAAIALVAVHGPTRAIGAALVAGEAELELLLTRLLQLLRSPAEGSHVRSKEAERVSAMPSRRSHSPFTRR